MTNPSSSPSSPPLGISDMTLERAVQVLQTRQRWRESERKDRLQCWPGSQAEINSIEETQAVDVVLTAIAALEAQVPQWRDIATAPKNGTLFLVWAPDREGLPPMYSLCTWHPEAGFCIDELREPTRWMPLPPSPTGL